MLEWYTALLDLRKKYVTRSERTCKAELHDGILSVQIPASRPKLKVLARIQGHSGLPPAEFGWKRVLAAETEGVAVETLC